jgi:alpha-galactosidase
MTPTGDLSSRPHVDESASGTRLKVGGRRYARGIGVNAWSDVRYYLGGRCARFTTDVGIDDSVPPPSGGTIRGAVRVRVVVDGRTRFQRLMDWSMPAAHVDVPVTGATELRLVADATRDWIWDDVLDWTAPRLTCAA